MTPWQQKGPLHRLGGSEEAGQGHLGAETVGRHGVGAETLGPRMLREGQLR